MEELKQNIQAMEWVINKRLRRWIKRKKGTEDEEKGVSVTKQNVVGTGRE